MISLLVVAAFAVTVLVTLVTCIQVLYLEALRIHARDLPSLEFFKQTLESKIGVSTERGALTFSLVKHIGLAVTGCLILAITYQGASLGQALGVAAVLTSIFTIAGTYIVPHIIYRRTSGRGLLPLTPLFRAVALTARPLTWLLEFLESLFDLGSAEQMAEQPSPEEHIGALITAGREEGIIEEADRELIQSVVAFGDKTVREVMTPRPKIVAIRQDATLEELRQVVINEQFSRIPAYETDIDSICGFVHVRDMFEVNEDRRATRTVREIMRPIRAVPETKPVNDLLREMQAEGAYMAVVVDVENTAPPPVSLRWKTWWRRLSAKSTTSMNPSAISARIPMAAMWSQAASTSTAFARPCWTSILSRILNRPPWAA